MPGKPEVAPANQSFEWANRYPSTEHVQVSFGGGVNPMAPSHLVAEDEVVSATNVDFSLVAGALVPRRGCHVSTNLGTSSISRLFRNYNDNPTITAGFMYAVDGTGNVYRGTGALQTGFTAVATLGSAGLAGAPAFGSYKQYAVFSNATNHWKDDGTNVTEWIKQVPAKPVITVSTLAPILMTGTYTAAVGTLLGTTSQTATYSMDSQGNATVVYTFGTAGIDLSVNGTNTIGNFGVNIASIAFSDPHLVQKISWDYSIGDTSFTNYLHYEINPQLGGINVTDTNAEALIGDQLTVGTNTGSAITADERQNIISQLAQFNFNPLSLVSSVSKSLSPWAVTVPQFTFVGKSGAVGTNLWSSIFAARFTSISDISVTGTATYTNTTTVASPALYGARNYPLTDVLSGYYYWQTYATLDTNGIKVDEGAASPPAGPFPMQNAQVVVTNTATATGSKHGVNAIITYRQGGYMQDSYAVYTYTGTGTTSSVIALATITDTINDIDALTANFVMPRGLFSSASFPGDINSIAAPFADRIFVADANILRWSLPGQVGSFPADNFAEVGRIGDTISGLQVWNPGLIIINKASVYELTGTDFDTLAYTLTRTGCRRGSLAPDTVISTPYGIPLLNCDGLTMFVPGYNTEQEIPWFNAKYIDMFRGNAQYDPASYKGNRIPAINFGSIHHSVAGFRGHQLYLGIPTGPQLDGQPPDTLVVVDFQLKQAWWYTYPFKFTSIYVDDRTTIIQLGSTDGSIMAIESTAGDQTTAGGSVPMIWNVRTRSWTANTDTVLENISIDNEGNNIQVRALYDDFLNPLVGTLNSPVRNYTTPPLGGTFVNAVSFDFIGTYVSSSTTTSPLNAIYGLSFSILREPIKVQYWRTEYDEHGWTADKLWDVAYTDIDIPGTCTVSAVRFVDNTAVMTNTITGPTNGRVVVMYAYPPEIYGRVAYTTYTTS